MVTDAKLAEHLAHWGIDVMRMEKTEKSMAELQIDLNKGFEFDKITEAGAELAQASGARRVGLKNLGNTCYVNSVLQCLKEVAAYEQRYCAGADAIFESSPADPTGDFCTQMAKIAVGLVTDRYAKGSGPGDDAPVAAVQPKMFKAIVGKGHPEFSTGRQQDAVEYFQHLLEVMTRAERAETGRAGASDGSKFTASQFEFEVEERVACVESGKVRYVTRRENVLPLEVPVELATNKEDLARERELKRQKTESGESGERQGDDDAASEPTRPIVPFDACLSAFAADETVDDFYSTALGRKGVAAKRARLKTMPPILAVQVRRYYVAEDWTPKKLDVLVPMPETVDVESVRGTGLAPGEEELPADADEGGGGGGGSGSGAGGEPQAPVEPDASIVAQLVSMGFSEKGSKRAALATEAPPRREPRSGSSPTWKTRTSTIPRRSRRSRAANRELTRHPTPRTSRCSRRWALPKITRRRRSSRATGTSSARRIGSSPAPTTSTPRSPRLTPRRRAIDPPRRHPGCRVQRRVRGRAGQIRALRGCVAHGRQHRVRSLRRARQDRGPVAHLQRSQGGDQSEAAARAGLPLLLQAQRVMRLGRGGFGNSPTSRIKKRFCRFACRVSFLGRVSQPSGFTTSTTRARTPRPSQVSGTISGHQFLKTPRAYRIPQVLKLWRDPATFTCGPTSPRRISERPSWRRTASASSPCPSSDSGSTPGTAGTAWTGLKTLRAAITTRPTVAVAVNFGAPCALDALDVKLPDGRVDDRTANIVHQSCRSWHGVQPKSLADILHVEIRDRRLFDDSTDPRAIVSLPIASFIESAFVNADADGAKQDLSFESPDCKTSGTVTVRLKFHLQADVLAALARGVGLEDASGASVVAADTLAAVKLGVLLPDKDAERKKMEADEAKTFKRSNNNGKGADGSYNSMTAGIKRFLSERVQVARQAAQPVRQHARQLRTPGGAALARQEPNPESW